MALGTTQNLISMEPRLERITANTFDETESLASAFFKEARPGEVFNFPHLSAIWKQILELDRGFVFVTRAGTGKISGVIGAICGPDPYTGLTVCFPQFWYVFPEYRGRKDGLQLFRELEREAAERGSRFILHGHMTCINLDGLEPFFMKNGYKLREKVYRKDLKI